MIELHDVIQSTQWWERERLDCRARHAFQEAFNVLNFIGKMLVPLGGTLAV